MGLPRPTDASTEGLTFRLFKLEGWLEQGISLQELGSFWSDMVTAGIKYLRSSRSCHRRASHAGCFNPTPIPQGSFRLDSSKTPIARCNPCPSRDGSASFILHLTLIPRTLTVRL
jgi:hypothetical protein